MATDHSSTGGTPLTPATFHILLALAGGERHGYAIMQEVATLTEEKIRLGPGTLYRSIKALLAEGLIEETSERPDPALDDERRRYYRLTEQGNRAAAAEGDSSAGLAFIFPALFLSPPARWRWPWPASWSSGSCCGLWRE